MVLASLGCQEGRVEARQLLLVTCGACRTCTVQKWRRTNVESTAEGVSEPAINVEQLVTTGVVVLCASVSETSVTAT